MFITQGDLYEGTPVSDKMFGDLYAQYTYTHKKVRKLKYRINKKDKWQNTLLLKILKDFLYAHQGCVMV